MWPEGPFGDLREGLEMSGTSVVEMRQLHWKKVEKDKCAGPHPKRFKFYRWKDTVWTEVSKVCGNADGFAESAQQTTGWLQFAQNRVQWRQFVRTGKLVGVTV